MKAVPVLIGAAFKNRGVQLLLDAVIEAARARGVDVAADMYPYTAGGTGLEATIPSWAAAGAATALLLSSLAGGAQAAPKAKPPASVLSSDLTVTGNLKTTGDIQVEGTVEGDIRAPRVAIADGARFKGSIDMDTPDENRQPAPLRAVKDEEAGAS